jgi:hypothetical protein
VICTPFSASFATPSLLADPTVGAGFDVFVAACAVTTDGWFVDTALGVLQADKTMDAMNSMESIFFIV